MNRNLVNINRFLAMQNNEVSQPSLDMEKSVVLSGPDTVKNIMISETLKLGKLEVVQNMLIDRITDAKVIDSLPYKEQQSLLRLVTDIQINSRDFIIKLSEIANKNEMVKKAIELAAGPKEVIISENGTVFETQIDETQRKHLSELLRDMLNDTTRV